LCFRISSAYVLLLRTTVILVLQAWALSWNSWNLSWSSWNLYIYPEIFTCFHIFL